MILTTDCYNSLVDKIHHLKFDEQASISQRISEIRPMGDCEDDPEYLEAMDALMRVNVQISELQKIIDNATIFNTSMVNPSIVGFGATVTFTNLDDDTEKTYTITSIYDSDVSNGKVSIEAPLIKEMVGKKVGDCFYFRDHDFEITNIYYACLK